MTKTTRFYVAAIVALLSLVTFFRANVGLGMVLGLSTAWAMAFAVMVSIAAGIGFAFIVDARNPLKPADPTPA